MGLLADNRLEPFVLAAAEGDADAFARLVDASRNAVTAIALAICRDVAASEDVAQEAYLVAWRRLGELRNPASFLPWIRQITRYTAQNRARDQQSRNRLDGGMAAEEQIDDRVERAVDRRPSQEAYLLEAERDLVIEQALDRLPSEAREVVILYYREGRSTRQVASLLGLSDAAVRKRLQRARSELRREVLDRFAEIARSTAPGVAFTTAVMAATAGAPVASAAGLAIAGGAAGSKSLGAKSLALLGGVGLGFLGGASGVILGLREDFRNALDEHERRQLRALRNTALLAVLLFSTGFAIPAIHGHWLGPMILYSLLIATLGVLYLVWLPRLVRRRLLAQYDGDAVRVEACLAKRRRWSLFGWLGGGISGLAGLLFGLSKSGLL